MPSPPVAETDFDKIGVDVGCVGIFFSRGKK
jgi:hypothetical protein